MWRFRDIAVTVIITMFVSISGILYGDCNAKGDVTFAETPITQFLLLIFYTLWKNKQM